MHLHKLNLPTTMLRTDNSIGWSLLQGPKACIGLNRLLKAPSLSTASNNMVKHLIQAKVKEEVWESKCKV